MTSSIDTGLVAGIDASQATQGAAEFNRAWQSMGASAEKGGRQVKTATQEMGTALRGTQSAVLGLKSVFLAFGLGEFVRELINTQNLFNRVMITLESATGSAASAKEEWNFLLRTVHELGLNLPVAAEQFATLQAAARGTSLEGDQAQKVFHAFAGAISALHLPADRAALVLGAVQRMMSTGIVNARELRMQLAFSLPGAMKMAADAMGMSQQKMNEMMRSGKLMAEDLLPKMADALEKRYGKAALDAAGSTQGLLNKLATAKTELQLFMVQGGLGPVFDRSLKRIADALSSNELKKAMANFGGVLGPVIEGLISAFVFLAQHAEEALIVLGGFTALKTIVFIRDLASEVGVLITQLAKLQTLNIGSTLAGFFGGGAAKGIAAGATATTVTTSIAGPSLAEMQTIEKTAAATAPSLLEEAAAASIAGNAIKDFGGKIEKVPPSLMYFARSAQMTTEAKLAMAEATALGLPLFAKEGLIIKALESDIGAANAQLSLFGIEQTAVNTAAGVGTAAIAAEGTAATACSRSILAMAGAAALAALNFLKMAITAPIVAMRALAGAIWGVVEATLAWAAANPVLALAIILSAAVIAMYEYRDALIEAQGHTARLKDYTSVLWKTDKAALLEIYDAIKNRIAALLDLLPALGEKIRKLLVPDQASWEKFHNWFKDTFIGRAISGVESLVSAGKQGAKDFMKAWSEAAEQNRFFELMGKAGVNLKQSIPNTVLGKVGLAPTQTLSKEQMDSLRGMSDEATVAYFRALQDQTPAPKHTGKSDDKPVDKLSPYEKALAKAREEFAATQKNIEILKRYDSQLTAGNLALAEENAIRQANEKLISTNTSTHGKEADVLRAVYVATARLRAGKEEVAKKYREENIALDESIQDQVRMVVAFGQGEAAVRAMADAVAADAAARKLGEAADEKQIEHIKLKIDAETRLKHIRDSQSEVKSLTAEIFPLAQIDQAMEHFRVLNKDVEITGELFSRLREKAISAALGIDITDPTTRYTRAMNNLHVVASQYSVDLEVIKRRELDLLELWRQQEQDRLMGMRTAIGGFRAAILAYYDDITNKAKASFALMTDALKGFEDELVKLLTFQKTDFGALFKKLGQDLVRMEVQQHIMKPLTEQLAKLFGVTLTPKRDGQKAETALFVTPTSGGLFGTGAGKDKDGNPSIIDILKGQTPGGNNAEGGWDTGGQSGPNVGEGGVDEGGSGGSPISRISDFIKNTFTSIKDFFTNIFTHIKDGFSSILSGLGGILSKIGGGIGSAAGGIFNALKGAGGAIVSGIKGIGSWIGGLFHAQGGIAGKMFAEGGVMDPDNVVKFAKGGIAGKPQTVIGQMFADGGIWGQKENKKIKNLVGGMFSEGGVMDPDNVVKFAKGGVMEGKSQTVIGQMFADGGISLQRDNKKIKNLVGTMFGNGGIAGNYARGGIAAPHKPQIAIFGEGDYPEAYIPLLNRRSVPVMFNRRQLTIPLPNGSTIPAHMAGGRFFESGGIGGTTVTQSFNTSPMTQQQRNVKVEVHLHGIKDVRSFVNSKPQVEAALFAGAARAFSRTQ